MFLLEKKTASEYIVGILRKEIMLKKYAVGFHLKESEIANSMNVSRGPIREALNQLQTENLVKKNSNGRCVVCKFEQKDIENLYNARILLEKAALSEINTVDLKESIGRFNELVELMNSSEINNEVDMSFHELIIKLSNNKTLEQLWFSLKGVLLTLMEITNEYLHSRNIAAIEEHELIVKNVEAGDLNSAQLALENHLKDAANHYTDAVKDLQNWR